MNYLPTLLIRHATLVDPSAGRPVAEDLLVQDGRLRRCPFEVPAGAFMLNAPELLVFPGFMDLHTHLREPGNEEAETVQSAAAAAAAGGFVAVVAMPNTRPPLDRPGRVRDQLERAAGCPVAVWPTGCLSLDRAGREPADYAGLREAGAVALTDDGSTPLSEPLMLHAAIEAARLGLPILDHAEDAGLARGGVVHDGALARRTGLPGLSPEAETAMIERDIRLAEKTGCHFHIQHISTRRGVELVGEARSRGVPVTAEATPHHLFFTEDDIDPGNANYKMNPPLRTADDRRAIREGVATGIITVLATDHAPHAAEAKRRGFLDAPFGIIGLETALAATYDVLVKTRRMSLADWAKCWTVHPAGLLGLPRPSLADGAPADLTILSPCRTWTLTPADIHSRSLNTPFLGHTFTTRPVATMRAGEWIWRHPDL